MLPAMTGPHEREEATRREALAELERLRERETFGTSALAQAARRATDHFAAKDAVGEAGHGATDQIELWGRRIGRGLSLVAFIGLAIYLYVTYLR
jgi:ferric-dicitrate binding protein FerR (iron transport regulator)